jgi:hypothetical protein
MSLKTSELVAVMETVMAEEYSRQKGTSLPGVGGGDRRLLFTAVAGGVLQYLESKQQEVISTITLRRGAPGTTEVTFTVTNLNLNIGL